MIKYFSLLLFVSNVFTLEGKHVLEHVKNKRNLVGENTVKRQHDTLVYEENKNDSKEPGEECYKVGERVTWNNECTRYLECGINRFFDLKMCINGEIFDSEINNCVDPSLSRTDCSRQCTFRGRKPLSGNKKGYIYCEKGLLKIGTCPIYYNRFSQTCEKIELVINDNQKSPVIEELSTKHTSQTEKPTPETTTSTATTTITTTRATTIKPTDHWEPSCREGSMKAHKRNCKQYYECNGSDWIKKKCSFGQFFDEDNLHCVYGLCVRLPFLKS